MVTESENTQIKLRIIFQVIFNLCFSPRIKVSEILHKISGQLWNKVAFFIGVFFFVIRLICGTCLKRSPLFPAGNRLMQVPFKININK